MTRLLVTFFGIGYIPFVPATWASAVAALLVWYMPGGLLIPFAVLTTLAFLACRPAVRIFASKDPQTFVLDEVCGIMLTFLTLPKTAAVYIAGFVLFRIFDAWKPWPISRIQNNDHPWCIVWDDLAAGLVANLILQVAIRTLPQLMGV